MTTKDKKQFLLETLGDYVLNWKNEQINDTYELFEKSEERINKLNTKL